MPIVKKKNKNLDALNEQTRTEKQGKARQAKPYFLSATIWIILAL